MTGLEITLDGHALGDIAESILVEDVRVSATETLATVPGGGSPGRHVTQRVRESLTVTVIFEVHEQDPALRQDVLDRVAAWCRGTVLCASTHPGRMLRVTCAALPDVSALCWTEQLQAVFTAYGCPYWEAETASVASGTGELAEMDIHVPGNAATVLEVEAENRSAMVCTVAGFRANDSVMSLCDLALAPGETLSIGHDEAGRLTLSILGEDGVRSVYANRDAASSDELLLYPGKNRVTCCADCELAWRVRARGRWL